MHRHQTSTLRTWLAKTNRKPLVIRGARQVGKSTVVRQFADHAGVVLHEVNLERHQGLDDLFATNDPTRILREIQLICRKGPLSGAGGSVLFLDEIQAAPKAIEALRYLAEDTPTLPIVAAGSLLEAALWQHKLSMPVGRIEYLFMGPMTFAEFLAAAGDQDLLDTMAQWQPSDSFPTTAHTRLSDRLREYLFLGGMPEVLANYLVHRDLSACAMLQDNILQTYRDDLGKYAAATQNTVRRVFDYMALHVGEKLKYVNIDRTTQPRALQAALEKLIRARVVLPVHHSSGSGVPLGAGKNHAVYKTYFLDVGLAARAANLEWQSMGPIMSQDFINKGQLAEQYVAQHLWADQPAGRRPELFYWLRQGRRGNAELDFLVQVHGRIVPIEVKAGASGRMKSLFQFAKVRQTPLAVRFDANPPTVSQACHQVDDQLVAVDLLSLPLYMVEQSGRLAQGLLNRP